MVGGINSKNCAYIPYGRPPKVKGVSGEFWRVGIGVHLTRILRNSARVERDWIPTAGQTSRRRRRMAERKDNCKLHGDNDSFPG